MYAREVLALIALLVVCTLGGWFARGTDYHSNTALVVPNNVKTAVAQGWNCWLETEVTGDASWYCGNASDDNVWDMKHGIPRYAR